MVLIGRTGWLYWRLNADLDLRVGITDTGDSLHIQTLVSSSTDPTEPLTRAALRDVPIGVLQRALTGGPLLEGIRTAWNDKSAPDLRHDRCNTAKADAHLANAATEVTPDETLRVEPVQKGRRPDSFYEQVEHAYALAVARGNSGAAQQVADANDVPITTVYRWLKEARRRNTAKAAATRAARKAKPEGLFPEPPDPQQRLDLDDPPQADDTAAPG